MPAPGRSTRWAANFAQGFLFGEPMSADQARALIAPEKMAAAR